MTLVENGSDVDEYGDPIETTSTVTARCELQQVSRLEQLESGVQSEDWALFLAPTGTDDEEEPVTIDLEGSDRLTVDGETYEVVGPPWPVRHPITGEVSHIEARVRQVS